MKKLVKLFILTLVLVTAVNLTPVAAEEISTGNMESVIAPAYIVTSNTSSSFQISGNVAHVAAYYCATSSFSHANVYIFLQKEVDGQWKAAKSDTSLCGWADTSTDRTEMFQHSMTFDSHGYYRAKFVYYIYNKAGERDVITEYIYRTY